MYHPFTLREEICRAWIGRPVCAVMKDGSERIGIITDVRHNKLVLNGRPPGSASTKRRQASTGTRKRPTVRTASTRHTGGHTRGTTIPFEQVAVIVPVLL